MSDNKVVWTRYRWDLSGINVNLQQPSGYIFRSSSSTETQGYKVLQSEIV